MGDGSFGVLLARLVVWTSWGWTMQEDDGRWRLRASVEVRVIKSFNFICIAHFSIDTHENGAIIFSLVRPRRLKRKFWIVWRLTREELEHRGEGKRNSKKKNKKKKKYSRRRCHNITLKGVNKYKIIIIKEDNTNTIQIMNCFTITCLKNSVRLLFKKK